MELTYVYATLAVIILYFLGQVLSKRFDPFAPVWLFLVGYVQVYVIQALSYHEWALGARGVELVTAANERALWALLLFLVVYHCGIPGLVASVLPTPPQRWSLTWVCLLSPVLVLWGLFCALMVVRDQTTGGGEPGSAEVSLLRAFPSIMLVAANLLIVSGRYGGKNRPLFIWSGMGIAALYVALWMFNGRRSHALIGLLSASCAFYISKFKRPSWPVLFSIAGTGAMLVALALGWRYKQMQYTHDIAGFVQFAGDFDPAFVLECLNMKDSSQDTGKPVSKETEEYGGFLLMMDTVPERSEYDCGATYLRTFSTFIPRIVWREKPLYGREQWVNAWIAGSEMKRGTNFTGPAISVLGAAQLNGGAWATAIVMTVLALLIRTAFDFFRRHPTSVWVQAFWGFTYMNAWFMVVNDDPMIWFYYNWGFTGMPVLLFLWIINRQGTDSLSAVRSLVPA